MAGKVNLDKLTDRQQRILKPMADKITAVIGAKLKGDINVVVLPRDEMPLVPASNPPIHSSGFTPTGWKIQINRTLMGDPKLARDVLGHEAIHAFVAQVGKLALRQAVLALLPAGAKWDDKGYAKDGREAIACYGSAALFGVSYKPPYSKYYDFSVPQAQLPQLASALLADYPDPPVVEDPPLPTPVDVDALQQKIEDLEAELVVMERAVETRDAQIAELTATNTSLSGTITSLQGESTALRQRLTEIATDLQDVPSLILSVVNKASQ